MGKCQSNEAIRMDIWEASIRTNNILGGHSCRRNRVPDPSPETTLVEHSKAKMVKDRLRLRGALPALCCIDILHTINMQISAGVGVRVYESCGICNWDVDGRRLVPKTQALE